MRWSRTSINCIWNIQNVQSPLNVIYFSTQSISSRLWMFDRDVPEPLLHQTRWSQESRGQDENVVGTRVSGGTLQSHLQETSRRLHLQVGGHIIYHCANGDSAFGGQNGPRILSIKGTVSIDTMISLTVTLLGTITLTLRVTWALQWQL